MPVTSRLYRNIFLFIAHIQIESPLGGIADSEAAEEP